MPNAKSRTSGYFQLTSHPNEGLNPKLNGPVLVECNCLKHVVSSAAEAETTRVFYNAKIEMPIRCTLECLHQPHPHKPLKTENSTACGFVTNNIHQKRSKYWDVHFHWLRDKQPQHQKRHTGKKEALTMLTM